MFTSVIGFSTFQYSKSKPLVFFHLQLNIPFSFNRQFQRDYLNSVKQSNPQDRNFFHPCHLSSCSYCAFVIVKKFCIDQGRAANGQLLPSFQKSGHTPSTVSNTSPASSWAPYSGSFSSPPPPPPTSLKHELYGLTSGFTRLIMKTKYVWHGLISLHVNFHENHTKWTVISYVKICRWGGGGLQVGEEKEHLLIVSMHFDWLAKCYWDVAHWIDSFSPIPSCQTYFEGLIIFLVSLFNLDQRQMFLFSGPEVV